MTPLDRLRAAFLDPTGKQSDRESVNLRDAMLRPWIERAVRKAVYARGGWPKSLYEPEIAEITDAILRGEE